MAFLLATVAQFKTFQKGDIPSSLDATLALILGGVTSRFATHCRRQSWDQTTWTEYVSHRVPPQRQSLLSMPTATGRDSVLWVQHTPIDTAQPYSLYDDPARVFGPESLMAPSDYVVFAD